MKKIILGFIGIVFVNVCLAQNGLEGLIIEKYYLSNENDTTVNDVGGKLPVGSMTYRFYLDLLPGYRFQAAYGLTGHELRIETSTLFFNNEDRGDISPSYTKGNAKDNTVMLDSWLSAGAACVGNFGVLKNEDTDNAATVNNGESPQVLQNDNVVCGIPIKTQDGLQSGTPGVFGNIGIDTEIGVFGSQNDGTNGPVFSTTNGSWYCLGGSTGADTTINKVLIAQITTNGVLKYKLNVQIGTPSGDTERYVAESLAGDTVSILFPTFNDSVVAPSSIQDFYTTNNTVSYQVFPNPVNEDVINIKSVNGINESKCSVSIYDSKGILVKTSQELLISKLSTPISVKGLSSGIYFIKVEDAKQISTQKIIINH
jgi:hypothetical protein